MIITISILTVSFLVSYIFALKQVYQIQLSEYRLDRFMTMLRDSGFANFFIPKVIYPAKTFRNISISIITFCLFIFLNYAFYLIIAESIPLLILFAILNYIFVKILVILSSYIMLPVANFARRRTVNEAKQIVQDLDVVTIGVTGSFGKSSVKEFLYKILSEKHAVERTGGNRNTDIGVALELKEKMHEDLDFFVCEMGAYKRGEIQRICDFVKPKYGILTAIGNQHMDLFKTIQNLVKAKSELIQALPEDGVGIVNADNEYVQDITRDVKCKIITYGLNKNADYCITRVGYKGRLMFVEFMAFGRQYKFTSALLGEHQAVNLLGVIALALELKVSYELIQKAIAKMEPLESKLSVHLGVNDSVVLNDGYNSNPHGFLAGLEVAKKLPGKRKYVFSYGMFELGKERTSSYKKVVDSIVNGDMILLTLDKRFFNLNSENVIYFKTEIEVIEYLKENLTGSDLFMLEGRCTKEFLNFLNLRKYELQD